MRHILTYIATLVILSLCLPGCNTSGCLENRSSIPLAGFYSSATAEQISIDSLTIIGIGMHSEDPLSDGASAISSIYLPMRSTMQTTSWLLTYPLYYPVDSVVTVRIEVNDTITFDYDSTPYFASDECGVIYKYAITHMAYTTHLIDSVAITDSIITNVDVERIKIYFRTE